MGIRCSDVVLHSRMTTDDNNVLCISKKVKERILNAFIIKK
jgi:hypothetical protein